MCNMLQCLKFDQQHKVFNKEVSDSKTSEGQIDMILAVDSEILSLLNCKTKYMMHEDHMYLLELSGESKDILSEHHQSHKFQRENKKYMKNNVSISLRCFKKQIHTIIWIELSLALVIVLFACYLIFSAFHPTILQLFISKMQEATATPPTTESKSIEQCSHSHPYEYLTKLNQVFSGYNRSTTKDYSSASKIKLPFYKFSQIKVPQIFESSYAKERKGLVNYDSIEICKFDEGDRKLWKEHKDIIQNYLKHKQEKKVRQVRNKNKEVVDKIVSRDRNNLFLKKIIEKGTTFDYDQEQLEKEVLFKLKNLNKSGSAGLKRCHTAKCLSIPGKLVKSDESQLDGPKDKVSESDYLQCSHQQEMIVKYKALMKKADFSISDQNIYRTSELLSKMKRMVEDNHYY